MRILLINYRYFLSGGPEKYMFSVKELLEKHRHEVIPFSVKSKKNVPTKYEKYFADPISGDDKTYFEEYKKNAKTILQIMERQFYSRHVKKKLEKLIKDTNPDVCYLMHHYNKLSPSVIDACKKYKLPVVMRLSDFFLVCPNALLTRDSHACEECIHKSLCSAVKHKCIKNSYFGSLIKVSAMYFHRLIKIYNKVNYVIAPSSFTINKIKLKFPKMPLIQIHTFVNITQKYDSKLGTYGLLVARIEEEKGILTAIKAFEGTKYKLKIAGQSSTNYGEIIKNYLKDNKIKNVELLGPKYSKELLELYKNSRFVIVPAECYENMPNVALEAMSYSKPVIASDLGSLKEIVTDNYNGLLFESKNFLELRRKVEKLFKYDALVQKLGKNSYKEAITKYNPEKHYNKLIETFNKSITEEKRKWKRS
jgi:glycosyltransferase involved in cell wall biosynthesis